MDLNLFEGRENKNNFINKFIEELKNELNHITKETRNRDEKNNELDEYNIYEKNNELDEYNIYEKKKIFLDNKSRKGNELAWVMDNDSVCISKDGDGGPISISEIDLPKDIKVGDVYEKIDGKYVYNPDITVELNNS